MSMFSAKPKKRKVYVGMSGGVDSSVAALLLRERGFDVVGVFIKVWQPDFVACTWKEDRLDAMRVAATLGIPFETLDLEEVYKREVIDYMLRSYERGITPNPDVMCNRYVKFGAFLSYARSRGADLVATGHYARIAAHNGAPRLRTAVDGSKDQTYFLWTLTRQQLDSILFPVGEMHKREVRAIAERYGLVTAKKKDSQGLCFVGKLDFRDLLKRYVVHEPGEVVTEDGRVIGEHEGVCLYTIGQRHGFTTRKESTWERPYYVVRKDVEHNQLVVAHRESLEASGGLELRAADRVWRADDTPPEGLPVMARVRYRQRAAPARVYDNGKLTIFEEPQLVDVGQSVVWYRGEVCLGGGVITHVAR